MLESNEQQPGNFGFPEEEEKQSSSRLQCIGNWLKKPPWSRIWRAITQIAQAATLIAVFTSAVTFCQAQSQRTEESHHAAWQVINSAQGKGGSGGRVDALTDLNKDGVDLAGVNLDGAFLQQIRLPNARMTSSSARDADLRDADFSDADLGGADLGGANLRDADFSDADLWGADLGGANLAGADLGGADLIEANLADADLTEANLADADLKLADVGAYLGDADLSGADLSGADLSDAKFSVPGYSDSHIDALVGVFGGIPHFSGAEKSPPRESPQESPQESLEQAEGNEYTKLPEGLKRPKNWGPVTR